MTSTLTRPGLDAEIVEALRAGMRGEVIVPADPGYDAARAVWNGAIDRRPGAVARCAGTADVLHAVNVARSAGLLVAVRSGGHSFAGNGVCDDGLVIDLAPMRGIRVDPGARRARCGAGVLWGELDHETQAFGLATPGGVISHTGVAGLTLGGGLGWLNRRHGLSCDNLAAVDLVTADGQLVHAGERQNEDLFWGLRGGGGNFGIATSFEFAVHPVGPSVLAGLVLFRLDRAGAIGRFAHEWASGAPRELSTIFAVATAPPEPFVIPEAQGQRAVMVLFCWTGALDEGERVLAPLRALGGRVGEMVAVMPYTAWQAALDPDWPHGTRMYSRTSFADELTSEAAEAMAECVRSARSPLSGIFLHQLGGAVRDVAADATAYGHRAPEWNVVFAGVWGDEPDGREVETAWARGSWSALAPSRPARSTRTSSASRSRTRGTWSTAPIGAGTNGSQR
jgi:FAD/FMN-containing dehydrogenase